MPDAPWDRFMKSFFGDPFESWHDGLDIEALQVLSDEQKKEAEKLMLQDLEKNYRGVVGLGELESRRALPVLKNMFLQSDGQLQIDIAVALEQIEKKNVYIPSIIEALKSASSAIDRSYAAKKLRSFHTPEVQEALFEALHDSDAVVRLDAAESLLFLHGLEDDILDYPDLLENLRSETSEKEHTRAVELLKSKIKA
jgi:HEAT repeat protein